jgi:hypothetical protein
MQEYKAKAQFAAPEVESARQRARKMRLSYINKSDITVGDNIRSNCEKPGI